MTVGFAAMRDLVTRRLSRAVPTLFVTVVSTAIVTVMGGLLSVGTPWVAPEPRQWALIVGAAFFVTTAVGAIVGAMRIGEVGFVAPFRYAGLVGRRCGGAAGLRRVPGAG